MHGGVRGRGDFSVSPACPTCAGGPFEFRHNFGRSVIIGSQITDKIGFRSHPYGMRPETNGFSHGLSNSPPDCLIPSLRSGRPFESRHSSKKSGDCGCSHRIFGRSIGIRTRRKNRKSRCGSKTFHFSLPISLPFCTLGFFLKSKKSLKSCARLAMSFCAKWV